MKQIPTIKKVISGGQTGADMGGLLAAKELGIETGGFAPKGWRTELGPKLELADFGLIEHDASTYDHRTKANVESADFTLIVSVLPITPGSLSTIYLCEAANKPFFISHFFVHASKSWLLHELDLLKAKIDANFSGLFSVPLTLNVAGSRESKAPGIQLYTQNLVTRLLTTLDRA